jgi:hypothetical protein
MELSDFGGAGGLDNIFAGFLGVDGCKWLKAKAIDRAVSPFGLHSGVTLQRAKSLAGDPAFGRAVSAFRRDYYGTAEAVPFRLDV